MTTLDHLPDLRLEAELIHVLHRAGIPLAQAENQELWELAAALGMHRVEPVVDRDERLLVEAKEAEWQATQDARMERIRQRKQRRS